MTKHYILSNFLKASKTFSIYKKIFTEKNLEHSYSPIEIQTKQKSSLSQEELIKVEEFISNFRKDVNAKSIVVSNPFKQIIPQYCDYLIGQSKEMKTVNLITKKDNRLIGENIDGEAFFLGQKNVSNIQFKNKTILMLGCGGVSTAVSFALAKHYPKKIILFDISEKKIFQLKKKLQESFPHLNVSLITGENEISQIKPDIIYNGTGIGKISDNPSTIFQTPISQIPKNAICIDANYTPWKTKFLTLAEKENCKTLNGFSHMVAFTTLHLNKVLGETIPFEYVYQIGTSIIESGQ